LENPPIPLGEWQVLDLFHRRREQEGLGLEVEWPPAAERDGRVLRAPTE